MSLQMTENRMDCRATQVPPTDSGGHVLIHPFLLPAFRPRRHPTYQQGVAAQGPILVIDDEPDSRESGADILSVEGSQVQTAANGADGLLLVARARPSLIVLDMRMPIMNGWAFVSALRASGVKVPILVLTAAQNARRWAEEVNADGYVGKPFDLEELLTAVEGLLRGG